MKIGKYDFQYIETIEPMKENGAIAVFKPQNRYKNTKNLAKHAYGDKEFCRFKLQNANEVAGVYAWFIQGETKPIYIGETVNFKKRFNTGYGIISPRNCFYGGQKTNCKMNNVVLEKYANNEKIDIYFLETKDYKAVETELLLSVKTEFNVKNNKNDCGF